MSTDLLASVDAARDEIVELLQQLVRIPTVNRRPASRHGQRDACV